MSTPTGPATFATDDANAVVAAWRLRQRAEWRAKAREGMRRMLEEGRPSGPAPLGFVNRRHGNKAWVEEDPDTMPLVREAFRLKAEGRTVREIAGILNAKGLRSRRGKPLSGTAVWRILTNPIYCRRTKYVGA